MLQKDYVLETVRRFGDVLARWLRPAVLEANGEAIDEVENAMPESSIIVTSDSGAGYASYALLRLGDAYEAADNDALANVRREQARAISAAFGSELGRVPEEYQELERAISAERGEE